MALPMAGASGGTPGSPIPDGHSCEPTNMYLNFRHSRACDGLVVVEVALLDHSFAQGHLGLRSAMERAKPIAPSIWAVTTSGLMATPQSTAATMRSILTVSGVSETSATMPIRVPKDW